jgi:predicted nucleotidyltransferase
MLPTPGDCGRDLLAGVLVGLRNHFEVFRKRSQLPRTKPTGKTVVKAMLEMNNTTVGHGRAICDSHAIAAGGRFCPPTDCRTIEGPKLLCCEEAPMTEPLFTDREALNAVCRRHHIRRLSVFGSVLKGASRPESDVDLLVEFEPDAKPTLLTMAEIEVELSPLLRGRKVDLRTPRDLSRYFREEVVRTAQVQYEAG